MNKKSIELKINDILYHPLSLDIIPYKIIGIRVYEDNTVYEAQATGNVGACGRVKVLLTIDRKETIRFIGLSEDYEYDSGLQDFVEGVYYLNKNKARVAYYEEQRILCWSNMDNKERLYKEAKSNYSRVEKLIKDIKAEILKNKQ